MPLVLTPLSAYPDLGDEDRVARANAFLESMRSRRTVRDFTDRPVPMDAITAAINAAGLAPSGANRQPWHFVVVTDPQIKSKIRVAAEEEEQAFYNGRAPKEWLEALEPLGTDWRKPFLETAPALIVVFQELWGTVPSGGRVKNYYVTESVGIATGLLLAGLHQAGLATLTHTPSPMGFLREILKRPPNEKAAMIIVVGHPAPNAQVPAITKKQLGEIATFF
ncbi:MAG: nitroreductase family protein [Alphaproteobacteria bacterium]|nr:nitroreductase family protein [Alphaproteobacteria bacterium]